MKMARKPGAQLWPAAWIALWLAIARANCHLSPDSSWRDQSQQLAGQSKQQQQQHQRQLYRNADEFGDSSASSAAAEQQRVQAQEMAAYHRRIAALPPADAQRLTQIDLQLSDSHVTAQVGHPAYLKCAVSNLGDQLVSWARRRDWHILTSGRHVYTADERFQILRPVEDRQHPSRATSPPNVTEWILQIQFVQQRDGGFYICQVPTEMGLVSHQVQLEVLVPDVFILGPRDLIIDRGTTLSLVCIVENSPIPPEYVFWFLNGTLLNFQPRRRGVAVDTEFGSRTHSKLDIEDTNEHDTGNYTCSTSNGKPYSVYVQILAGDQAAVMYRQNGAEGFHWTTAAAATTARLLLGALVALANDRRLR